MLRRRSRGVARFSQHMLGHAMDFYIPGVPLEQLREIGLRLQRGGVGFYPTSGSPFVHMDTGGVRMWPRMTRDQLVRVFPDGRTVHIPSDGKPLPAMRWRWPMSARAAASPPTFARAARSAGVNVAENGLPAQTPPRLRRSPGFSLGTDEEDEDATPAAVARRPLPRLRPGRGAVAAALGHVKAKSKRR